MKRNEEEEEDEETREQEDGDAVTQKEGEDKGTGEQEDGDAVTQKEAEDKGTGEQEDGDAVTQKEGEDKGTGEQGDGDAVTQKEGEDKGTGEQEDGDAVTQKEGEDKGTGEQEDGEAVTQKDKDGEQGDEDAVAQEDDEKEQEDEGAVAEEEEQGDEVGAQKDGEQGDEDAVAQEDDEKEQEDEGAVAEEDGEEGQGDEGAVAQEEEGGDEEDEGTGESEDEDALAQEDGEEEEEEAATHEEDGDENPAVKKKIKVKGGKVTSCPDRKCVPGIIYLGHIPPRLRPKHLRNMLSLYGEIGRIFLQPEDKAVLRRKKRSGLRRCDFTEGWVEFRDKRVAKRVAASLHNTPMATRKRQTFCSDLWCIKYLHRFQWTHLSERLAYEQSVLQQRLRTEVSQAKKETNFFLSSVDRSVHMDRKRKQREKDGEEVEDKTWDFTQRRTEEEIQQKKKRKHLEKTRLHQEKSQSNVSLLAKIFNASQS